MIGKPMKYLLGILAALFALNAWAETGQAQQATKQDQLTEAQQKNTQVRHPVGLQSPLPNKSAYGVNVPANLKILNLRRLRQVALVTN